MAGHYASIQDAGATIGITLGTNTRPTSAQADQLLLQCDGIINGVVLVTDNMDDIYGFLRPMECRLFWKMVNNILALAEPERYDHIPVRLDDEDKEQIRMTHRKWASKSWQMGE